jgi:transcriptional regulator with XRE-family HTH domain
VIGREAEDLERKRATRNDRLRRAREARNLTQADVARHVRASTLTVSRWELGVQTPLPQVRERLCRLYGLTPQELGLLPDAPESEAAPAPVETRRPAGGSGPDEQGARGDLLGQVRRYWIGTELEDAAGPLPSLELGLVERPDAVDDPLRVSMRPWRADRPIPRGARIGDVYRQLGEQLLILGDPGAGKTTLLLELARELLADRVPSDPMPAVFHLASWTPEQRSLAQWLVDELHQRYGVARPLAREWIDAEQILPLLDGLDEVADRCRATCVAAINEFRRDHGQLPIAVCCRTGWYQELGTRLALRGAIAILPLTQAEVSRYLAEAGEELADVRALLADDEQLESLLTTPLFLKIAAIAYRGRSAAAMTAGPIAERRRHILGDYVDAMLSRSSPGSPFGSDRTRAWLSWLARTMRAHAQSVFYVDWMQPSWLPNPGQRWLVTRGISAAIGLVTGALVGLNWGGDWGSSLGPALFALSGLTTGVLVAVFHGLYANESRIAPAERLHWSWAALRRGFPRWLGIGLGIGLVGGVVFGLVLSLALSLRTDVLSGARSAGAAPVESAITLSGRLVTGAASGVLAGATIGLLITLAFGLMTGLEARFDLAGLTPGQSVEASGRNALIGGIVGACVFGLGFALFYGLGTSLTGPAIHRVAGAVGLAGVYWPVAAPNDIAVAVLVGGVVAGLQRGGGAYLRHRALVALLVRSGCAPRDYVAFLEYASRLVLLQRRGAGYEFMHRLLLEYFADLTP